MASAEGSAAGFMIAELATTLSQIEWRPGGALPAKKLRGELSLLVARLRDLALSNHSPPNLSAYIDAAFREAEK
jgi:hypothetical protein